MTSSSLSEQEFTKQAKTWLVNAMRLTAEEQWDVLLQDYYSLGDQTRDDAHDVISNNKIAHLELMQACLDNEANWVWTETMLIAFAPGFDRTDYEDNGIIFKADEQGVRCEPNGDSLARKRDAKEVSDDAKQWADSIGLHTQLIDSLLRLGADLSACQGQSGAAALRAARWPEGITLSTPDDDDDELDILVCGWTPRHDTGDHVPEGMAKDPEIQPWGVDCYYYYGVKDNPADPSDPLLMIVDHETEDEDAIPEMASMVFAVLVVDEE